MNSKRAWWHWFSTSSGVNTAVVLFNAILIGIMWNVVFGLVRVERQDAIRAAIDRNDSLAIAFEQYTVRTIESANTVIQHLTREYVRSGGKIDLAKLAADYSIDNRVIIGVVLADEHGNAMSTADSRNSVSQLNVADREHFRVHIERDGGRIFLGKPVVGRVTGQWVIPVTRRINKPDGTFGGVAMALIEPARFTDVLHDANLRPLDIISLVGLDGITRARLRGTAASWGQDISASPLMTERARHPIGNYFAKGQLDNVPRFFSYRTLPDYQVLTTVGTAEADVMAEFYRRQTRYFWAAGVISAVIAGFAVLLMLALASQRRAAAKVARSESRFRQMAENIRDVFFLSDADSQRMLYVSPAYEEIWGRSCESLYANPASWFEAIHPDDRASAEENYRKEMLAGTFHLEYRIVRPDGAIRWVESRVFPVRDDTGKVVRITGVAKDITERKRLEQEKEQYFKFFVLSTNPMCIADPYGCFKQVNPAFLQLTGYPASELLSKPFLDFVLPEDRQSTADEMKLQVETRPSMHFENRYVRKDGAVIHLSWMAYFDRHDGVSYATANDITERKDAEARIAFLNRVYAMLSGINTLIVRVHDRDELFREACRIAVEAGGFRMAWLAIVDRSVMKIVPVASTGVDEELLTGLKDLFLSSEGALPGNTISALAIREKKVIVTKDLQTNPMVPFGKQYAKSGIGSMAILPLLVADEAAGVLALYANEIEFFHEEELKLLTQLAGDIAFAIDHLDKRERLDYLAYYDVLTGLANRTLFLDRVAQHLRSAASGGHKLAVALIDLERFKNINDSLGWPAGDALLKQVAEWLTHITGDASLLARVGADHFAGVLPVVKQGGDVARLLEKTMAAFLEHPFRLNDAVFRIAAKVGIAIFPDDGADAETLFRNAEAALKKAKAGGDRYLFHTQKMTQAVAGKLTLENQLRQALDNEEFVLHYQPKINLASGKLTSAEALIRWNDPRTGLVPPGRFIPILEETGLIYEAGRWALKKAIADYLRWRAAGLPAVRIAVNVSPLQLRNRGFIDEVSQAIGIDAQAPAGLELELTESLIMADVKLSIASLQAIRAMDVTIAIDDFGTGFSSLSYLAKLPVDTLKIDRSFVIDMTVAPEGLALVSTIITLAHSLKLKVVAEGVETEEQSRLLRLLSCDEMQGFLFSKPVPGDVFEAKFLAPPPAG